MLLNIQKDLEYSRFSHTFVDELIMQRPIQTLIIAVFFISAYQDSIGCCFSSDNRYFALSVVADSERQQFFYFKNIFNSKMQRPIKNASKTKHSNFISTSDSTKTVKPIQLSLIGTKDNLYLYLLRKSFREFLDEETRGNLFSETRLESKIKAARMLLPESKKLLIGKSVII